MASCPTGSSYDPSAAVETFHGIPHTDIDLQDSPDQFDPSDTNYWEAIIIWACVPILVCVCILILMSIYFICVCCCCCCGGSRDWSKKPKIACGIFNISVTAVLLVMIAASLWAEVELNGHITDFLDTGRDAEDFFNQYGNDSTLYTEASQNVSLQNLEDQLEAQDPVPTPEILSVENLTAVNVQLGKQFADIDSKVDSIDLEDILNEADSFESIRHWVVIGYLCLVAVVLLLLILAILCGVCIANPAFLIIMVVVLVFITLTMWVAAGGSLATLVVSGDICSDPDRLVRNLTKDQSTPVDRNVINYYLICNETCYSNPFSESIDMARVAFMAIADEEALLQTYVDGSAEKDMLQPLLDAVVSGFNGSETAVDDVSSCSYTNELYLDALQALCTDTYSFAVVQFGLACGLCVGLLVLVVTVTFHAGFFCNSRKEYDEEAVAYEFPSSSQSGPSVWQSYGTHQHYNSNYSRYREPASDLTAAPEPPKYNELQQITNGDRPPSGGYDHTYDS